MTSSQWIGKVAAPIMVLADALAVGIDGLPADLPKTSYDLISRAAAVHGDRTAIAYFESVDAHERTKTLSYDDLFAQVTQAANLFHRLGIGPSDVIAILLPNLPETHVALWGAEAAGIVLPLNPMLEAATLAALIGSAGATVLVTLGADADLFAKACAVVERATSIAHVVTIGAQAGDLRTGVQAVDFATRARHDAAMLDSGRVLSTDDIASYFCTGGTTGVPKIAVRTHAQVMANAWMSARMLSPALNADTVMFGGLPLFHVNAVMVTGLVPFLTGASVLIATPSGFRAPGLIERFWEIVAHHRVTCFSAVPTLLAALLEHPSDRHDIASLRFAVCGAAPLSAELLHRFEATCNVAISEGYGLTETACVAAVTPIDGVHKAGSVGLPLPVTNIRTVALDGDGRFVSFTDVDEIGIIAIAGPHVFSGYLDPRHDAGAWIDAADGRRWLNTGDLGRIDSDGYLWLTGRAKDLIIRGGHNIDPSVIEEALYRHPDVALAAAIGRPDAYAGEIPVAYVQLRAGSTVDAGTLAAYVAPLIGERAAIPKAIIVLPALPLTAVGKIHKPSLRLHELAGVTATTLDAAGIVHGAIDAVPDDRAGALVRIAGVPDAHAVRAALAPFSFAFTTDPHAADVSRTFTKDAHHG